MPTSPEMNLPIPSVSVTPGPAWASLLVSCLNIIDGHNHTSGSGVPIPPSGLDINSDLPFSNNNATSLRAARFTSQSAAIAASGSDLNEIYVAGVDLYYNDGDGNQIRVTQSGSVTGASGTITGLPSGTASASYSAGDAKFVFQSATNTAANLDFAAAIMRNTSASSFGLTLQPPTLGANYSITLPALPVSQKIMTLDASGIMSAPYTVDGSTITISSNIIGVPDDGIGTDQIADAAITEPKNAASNYQISATCGTFSTTSTSFTAVTNLAINFTAVSGRPVFISIQSDSTATASFIGTNSGETIGWQILAGVRVVATGSINASTGGIIRIPVSSITHVDTAATAGNNAYNLYIKSTSGTAVTISGAKIACWQPNA